MVDARCDAAREEERPFRDLSGNASKGGGAKNGAEHRAERRAEPCATKGADEEGSQFVFWFVFWVFFFLLVLLGFLCLWILERALVCSEQALESC